MVKVGRRSLSGLLHRLIDPRNYRALAGIVAVHQRPFRTIVDEVFSSGSYPRTVSIRTPMGHLDAQLFSAADLSTLNLIFCRHDYYVPNETRTVVDIGSNIGLSTLFWLSRNRDSFVFCYEPSPASYQRLLENLAPFQGRYLAHAAAVSDFSGSAKLGLEQSGVYSSLDLVSDKFAECHVVHINEVLNEALNARGKIDVLKIDSEGHELRTLEAIDAGFWKYIRCVNVDCKGAAKAIPGDFKLSRASAAERFYR